MWLSSDHRGVRIYVRGEFVAPQQWLIQATVVRESGVEKGTGVGDRQRTLSELWQGIALESRVGRRRGAIAVRVVVDGDKDIAALFAPTDGAATAASPSTAPALGDDRARDTIATP